MIPPKLKKGDHVRIIAPSESFLPPFKDDLRKRGIERLEGLGLKVSFGKYVDVRNEFDSASVDQRLEDLYDAFADPSVQAVLAANGGSSANQLLKHLDYDHLKKNPKIFCGLSDLTEISSAIYKKTGLVTYYGPHFSMIGAAKNIDLSLDSMEKTFFSKEEVVLKPAEHFLNTQWDDELIVNTGFWTIQEGKAEAQCFGGNLMTFDFLMKNEFFPQMEESILYLEENHLVDFKGFQKEMWEILNLFDSKKIKGLVIGRFQKESDMSRERLHIMIQSMEELRGIPIVANVDISHTAPIFSIPFGGKMKLEAGKDDEVSLMVTEH